MLEDFRTVMTQEEHRWLRQLEHLLAFANRLGTIGQNLLELTPEAAEPFMSSYDQGTATIARILSHIPEPADLGDSRYRALYYEP